MLYFVINCEISVINHIVVKIISNHFEPVDSRINYINFHYSNTFRNINHIENVPNSEENVTIYFSTQMVGMMETKAGRVEFLPRTTGLRKICLKASDWYV